METEIIKQRNRCSFCKTRIEKGEEAYVCRNLAKKVISRACLKCRDLSFGMWWKTTNNEIKRARRQYGS